MARQFKRLTEGLVAVPVAAADLTTKDTWIEQIVISNPTAGALTITILDKQGVPLSLMTTVSFATKTITIFVFPYPVKMIGGVNWVASGAGLNAEVKGYRLP